MHLVNKNVYLHQMHLFFLGQNYRHCRTQTKDSHHRQHDAKQMDSWLFHSKSPALNINTNGPFLSLCRPLCTVRPARLSWWNRRLKPQTCLQPKDQLLRLTALLTQLNKHQASGVASPHLCQECMSECICVCVVYPYQEEEVSNKPRLGFLL